MYKFLYLHIYMNICISKFMHFDIRKEEPCVYLKAIHFKYAVRKKKYACIELHNTQKYIYNTYQNQTQRKSQCPG